MMALRDPRAYEESFDLAELARRIDNLVRTGTVASIDARAYRVRVAYDTDEAGQPILTAPIPWLTARAGDDRTWWAPDVGEQVVLLSPSGDLPQAIAMPALFRDAHPAPSDNPEIRRTRHEDGAVFEYDRESHRCSIALPEDGELLVAIGESRLRVRKDEVWVQAGDGTDPIRLNENG